MAHRRHQYTVTVRWTGNRGPGTRDYACYGREHDIEAPGRPPISGSSDPVFRGDPNRWNPEQLLLAAAAACHKLWYLHLCAEAGIVVTEYADRAEGVLEEDASGAGRFTAITLRPVIGLTSGSDPDKARALHHEAHEKCFIANSIRVPMAVEPLFLPSREA